MTSNIPPYLTPGSSQIPGSSGQSSNPQGAADAPSVESARSQINSQAASPRSKAAAQAGRLLDRVQARIRVLQEATQVGNPNLSNLKELNRLKAITLEAALQNTEVMKAACVINPYLDGANEAVLKESSSSSDLERRAMALDWVLLSSKDETPKFRNRDGKAIKSLLTIQADIDQLPLPGFSTEGQEEVRGQILGAVVSFLNQRTNATVTDVDQLVSDLHQRFTNAPQRAKAVPWIARGEVGEVVRHYVEKK